MDENNKIQLSAPTKDAFILMTHILVHLKLMDKKKCARQMKVKKEQY